MSLWSDQELLEIFKNKTPLIDVRAPIEFEAGPIPNSINLPIMNNEERALVGTCYKKNGQAAAIKLGHELVSGEIKLARIEAWRKFLLANPKAKLFCFRGGLRSQTACQWIRESGIEIYPLKGGQKRLRNFLLSVLNEAPLPQFYRLGGLTGSGKTRLLHKIKSSIDLEAYANHRGSAFGNCGTQPTQTGFENLLANSLLNASTPTFVEDESINIGKIVIPHRLFMNLKVSPMILLHADQDQRIKNIFEDYILTHHNPEELKKYFLEGVERIKNKLSRKIYELLQSEISSAFNQSLNLSNHHLWIQTLLESYYDPRYNKGFAKNKNQIVFEGNESAVFDYLRSLKFSP